MKKRIYIEIEEPTNEKYTEISYDNLVTQNSVNEETGANINSNDCGDDANDRKLAKYFEDKYGLKNNSKKPKKKSNNKMIDIGYGYDETDSFIDNSEAYDEIVPDDWTTFLGGFYLNRGELIYRPIDQSTSKDNENEKNEEISKEDEVCVSKKPKKERVLPTNSTKIITKNKSKLLKKLKIKNENHSISSNTTIGVASQSNNDDVSMIVSEKQSSTEGSPTKSTQTPTKSTEDQTPKIHTLPEGLSEKLNSLIAEFITSYNQPPNYIKFLKDPNVCKIIESIVDECNLLSSKLRPGVIDYISYQLQTTRDTLIKHFKSIFIALEKPNIDQAIDQLRQTINEHNNSISPTSNSTEDADNEYFKGFSENFWQIMGKLLAHYIKSQKSIIFRKKSTDEIIRTFIELSIVPLFNGKKISTDLFIHEIKQNLASLFESASSKKTYSKQKVQVKSNNESGSQVNSTSTPSVLHGTLTDINNSSPILNNNIPKLVPVKTTSNYLISNSQDNIPRYTSNNYSKNPAFLLQCNNYKVEHNLQSKHAIPNNYNDVQTNNRSNSYYYVLRSPTKASFEHIYPNNQVSPQQVIFPSPPNPTQSHVPVEYRLKNVLNITSPVLNNQLIYNQYSPRNLTHTNFADNHVNNKPNILEPLRKTDEHLLIDTKPQNIIKKETDLLQSPRQI